MALFYEDDDCIFDEVNHEKEKYELLEMALDDIAANAYNKFDKNAMEYAQETLDKVEKLKEG